MITLKRACYESIRKIYIYQDIVSHIIGLSSSLYIHTWKGCRFNDWKTCVSYVECKASIGEVSQAFGVVATQALNKTV